MKGFAMGWHPQHSRDPEKEQRRLQRRFRRLLSRHDRARKFRRFYRWAKVLALAAGTAAVLYVGGAFEGLHVGGFEPSGEHVFSSAVDDVFAFARDLGADVESTLAYQCWRNAFDCRDFRTRAEAQAVYQACGGIRNDVHYLDDDRDGLACERLR